VQADKRKIIDAHFHLWNLDENYYPWLSDGDRPSLIKDFSTLRKNYLISDLLGDFGELNVIAGVHVQAEHDHSDVVRETRWLQKVADDPASRGFPHGIVADADFAQPDVERILEEHCAFRNMRGIRHALHRTLDAPTPYDPLQDPAWHRNFPLLAKFNLSFDMQHFPQQADDAVRLIRNNPDVPIILSHCAMPIWSDAERMKLWRDALLRYAEFPHVSIKISGFGSHDPGWSTQSIDPVISEIIRAFTPRRCMLASNFPVERLAKPYAEVWNIFADYFSAYSPDEQEDLFWRNAARIYRLNIGKTAYD
jgi:predicted TIM-barrel fold metal-dependent hydrolase